MCMLKVVGSNVIQMVEGYIIQPKMQDGLLQVENGIQIKIYIQRLQIHFRWEIPLIDGSMYLQTMATLVQTLV